MRWRGSGYRAHDPRWAFAPLSGAGAAQRGGRFNPVGLPALYLALTIEGMFLEMGHGLSRRFEPLTVCTYVVDVADVLDLGGIDGRAFHCVSMSELGCAWAYELSEGRRPPSWTLAERLVAEGAAGMVVPSFANGARPDMRNLVLWRWGPDLPHRVEVHDPSGRVPKSQLSWG